MGKRVQRGQCCTAAVDAARWPPKVELALAERWCWTRTMEVPVPVVTVGGTAVVAAAAAGNGDPAVDVGSDAAAAWRTTSGPSGDGRATVSM